MMSTRTMRGAAVLLAGCWLMLPLVHAQSVTKGPQIPNPQIEQGSLSKDAKGFGKPGSKFAKDRTNMPTAMGQVTVSDRCFVTQVDYCLMDGYAPIGEACYCSDGYYAYDGVVY